MGGRAQALADRFEEANRQIISAVERCTDTQWRTTCTAEGWSVAVVAHHVAQGQARIADLVRMLATGQGFPPRTREMIDQANAQHAQQHANCTREETLDLLRKNGALAAGTVRALSDEQLDRSGTLLAGRPPITVQQAIEGVLVGHGQGHLASIRDAIGAA